MLLYVDLEKAKKHLADLHQLSLFDGSPPDQAGRGGAGKHTEPVTVRAHTRHTKHGDVQVPQHIRMVVRVSPDPTPAEPARRAETTIPPESIPTPKRLDLSKAKTLMVWGEPVGVGETPPDEPQASSPVAALFGHKVTPLELLEITGITSDLVEDAEVHVGWDGRGVILNVEGPKIKMVRAFERETKGPNAGELTCYNSHFELTETKTGKGIEVFAAQVGALRAHGFERIKAWAAGNPQEAAAGGYNGYWTWPLFGFDGDLPDEVLDELPERFYPAERVSDLMRTPEGQDWWRHTGGNYIHVEFDLDPGSYSSKHLAKYVAFKRSIK